MAAQGKRKRSPLAAAREVETDAAIRRLEPVRAWLAQHTEEKTATTKAVAALLAQLITFGAETLGPNTSAGEKWTVKIPMRILQDWKAGGGLCEVLRAAFEFKNREGWRQFHLTTPGKKDKNLELYSHIYHHLIVRLQYAYYSYTVQQARVFTPPRVYFGGEIDAANAVRLGKLVKQIGGSVVVNEKEATHMVVQKGDEDTDFTEDEYVRTIDHRDNQVLVHWWYYPDSFDEWLPATEVQGKENPPEQHEEVWSVTSRFVTDSAKFNEWMSELDYEPEERNEARSGRGGGRRVPAKQNNAAATPNKAATPEEDGSRALRPRRSLEAEHKDDSRRRREARAGKRGRGSDEEDEEDEDSDQVSDQRSAEAKRKRKTPTTPVQQRAAQPEAAAATPPPARTAAATPLPPTPVAATPATPAHTPTPMVGVTTTQPAPHTPAPAQASVAPLPPTPVAAPSPAVPHHHSSYVNSTPSPVMAALPAGRPMGVGVHGPEARRNNTAARHRDPLHRGLSVPGQTPVLFNISQPTPHAPLQVPTPEETPPPYPPPQASWFKIDEIHSIEQKSLPEFFTGKPNATKTPALYKEYRDFMIHTYEQNPKQYLTQVACRRNLSGDVCGILRVHSMLEHWGLINCNVHPDTFPVTVPVPATANLQAIQAAMVQPTPPLPPPPANLISRREVIPLSKAQAIVCNSCNQPCPKLRYAAGASPYGAQQATKLELCATCYAEGKYPSYLSSTDFLKIDLGDDAILMEEAMGEEPWTEADTLKLLDAIDSIGENWDDVAKAVGKSKEACLLHFVRLPIEDSFLDAPLPAPRAVAQTPDPSMPFNGASNPVMSIVAFLASAVAPAVAAASAQAALSALLKEKPKQESETNGKADDEKKDDKKEAEAFASAENVRVAAAAALGAAAVKARLMAEREDRLVQRLVTQAVEVQLKKLELKLKHFDEMDELLDREHAQVEHARQALYNERLTLMQQASKLGGGDKAAAGADGHAAAASATASSGAAAPTPMQVDSVPSAGAGGK